MRTQGSSRHPLFPCFLFPAATTIAVAPSPFVSSPSKAQVTHPSPVPPPCRLPLPPKASTAPLKPESIDQDSPEPRSPPGLLALIPPLPSTSLSLLHLAPPSSTLNPPSPTLLLRSPQAKLLVVESQAASPLSHASPSRSTDQPTDQITTNPSHCQPRKNASHTRLAAGYSIIDPSRRSFRVQLSSSAHLTFIHLSLHTITSTINTSPPEQPQCPPCQSPQGRRLRWQESSRPLFSLSGGSDSGSDSDSEDSK